MQDIKLYPNPASEFINVSWSGEVSAIKVMDASGRILAQYNLQSSTEEFIIPVSSYEKGAYWLVLENLNTFQVKPWIK